MVVISGGPVFMVLQHLGKENGVVDSGVVSTFLYLQFIQKNKTKKTSLPSPTAKLLAVPRFKGTRRNIRKN